MIEMKRKNEIQKKIKMKEDEERRRMRILNEQQRIEKNNQYRIVEEYHPPHDQQFYNQEIDYGQYANHSSYVGENIQHKGFGGVKTEFEEHMYPQPEFQQPNIMPIDSRMGINYDRNPEPPRMMPPHKVAKMEPADEEPEVEEYDPLSNF